MTIVQATGLKAAASIGTTWSIHTNVGFNQGPLGLHARQEEILAGTDNHDHAAFGRVDCADPGFRRRAVHLYPVLMLAQAPPSTGHYQRD